MVQGVDSPEIPKASLAVKKKIKVSMSFDRKNQKKRTTTKNCPYKAGSAPIPIEKFLDHANETSINPWKPDGFQAAAKEGAANVASDLSKDLLKLMVRMGG
ncbi:MAG: hypothetical protein KVP17_001391 [Porospora cf. gigantea B]|nr:MAG: hypothetical protein KVP17_001391 [Porospora cf. gigantea B]